MRKRDLNSGPYWILFALLFGLVLVALAWLYQTQERFFYYWDWRGFHASASHFAWQWAVGQGSLWSLVIDSLRDEYNLYFAVPLAPFLVASDYSRTVFVLCIAAFYLTPFCLVVAFAMRRVFEDLSIGQTWAIAGLAVLIPTTWLTVMRGYPDVVAVAAFWLGMAIALGDPKLRQWRTVIFAGLFFALSVVLRRHLAYAVVAAEAAIALSCIFRARHSLAAWIRPATLLIVTMATLYALHPDFLTRLVAIDYGSLYRSYAVSPVHLLETLVGGMLGPILSAIVLVGLVAIAIRRQTISPARVLLYLFALIWLLIWFSFVRQDGPHHFLVILPTLVIAAICELSSRYGRRTFAALSALVGINAVVVYTVPQTWYWEIDKRFGIWSAYAGPTRRPDFDVVKDLTQALRLGPQPVLVAASSTVLNYEIVQDADRRFFRAGNEPLKLLSTPQIDSRDPLPIEDLLRAKQIVTVSPFQYHLADQAEQEVVSVVNDLIDDGDFEDAFVAQNSFGLWSKGLVEARIHRRLRPFAFREAVAIYKTIADRVDGTQPHFRDYWYWQPAEAAPGANWDNDGGRSFHFQPPAFLFDEPVSLRALRPQRGSVSMIGEIAAAGENCRGVVVGLGVFGGGTPETLTLSTGAKTNLKIVLSAASEWHPELTLRLLRPGDECYLDLVGLKLMPERG